MKNIFAKKSLRQEKSLGKILSIARRKKDISLEKAEIDTKIRLKYLKALEKDDFVNMPSRVYNIGFISRYCEYLGLEIKKHIDIHTRDKEVYDNLKQKKFSFIKQKEDFLKPGDPEKFRDKLRFVVTPQIFTTGIVVLIVMTILGYIWFQVKSFAAAPELNIANPEEQIVVSTDSIDISGKTDPTAVLFINNQAVSVNQSGEFRQAVKLEKGINEIEIKAENKANKETVKNVKVLVVSEDK